MTLEPLSVTEAVLHQEKTPHWQLESHVTYRLAPPHYVDLSFQFIPRAAVTQSSYLGVFWCSYVNEPQDNRLHFLGHEKGSTQSEWVHVASPLHKEQSAFYHNAEQARLLASREPSPTLALNEADVRYDKPFYYALRGDFAFIMMFSDPQNTVFAHSPTAGRPGDPGHPAWDFALIMRDPQVDRPCRFKARLAYKRFEGPEDAHAEWERWAAP